MMVRRIVSADPLSSGGKSGHGVKRFAGSMGRAPESVVCEAHPVSSKTLSAIHRLFHFMIHLF